MFDDLVQVIETLKQRIGTHREKLAESEAHTRLALIDPLLTALGWNVADPSLVIPEYVIGSRKPDYALLNAGPTPSAFIEAKKLHESIESHREQMTNYSNMAGVKYAGLTNGDRWELYDVFQQRTLDERRILDVSITRDDPYKCALKLLLLWRPNLQSGAPIEAEDSAFREEDASSPPLAAGEIPICCYYHREQYNAILQADGGVRLADNMVYTPSRAVVVATGMDPNAAVNGWYEWKHQASDGRWHSIGTLPNAKEMKVSAKKYWLSKA